MTVNMDLTQLYRAQMAMNETYKDLNYQVAQDVGKRSELGYFDVEFTMFGCAYLNPTNRKMYYKVSSQANDIYEFIEKASQNNIYASNLLTMTQKAPVPSGMKQLIAQDVKRDLAKKLQTIYPKTFFDFLYQLSEQIVDDSAAQILWDEAESLEGIFEEEKLQRFEELVHYAHSCCKITNLTYSSLLDWICKERRNMDNDFISKNTQEKTMYGIAYEENGKLKYLENAQQEYIYEKVHLFEMQGKFVTPTFSKTFGYNYNYRISDVMRDFKVLLRSTLDETYCNKIKALKNLSNPIQQNEFDLTKTEHLWNTHCLDTIKRYACRWNIKL